MMRRLVWMLLLTCLAPSAQAQQRTADFRYAPGYWYTPLRLVDDWQQTLGDERGRLLYDFVLGPHRRPKAIITV